MSQPTNGYLIISLDFELFWGVFDTINFENYKTNLIRVREIIPRLIALANDYNVKLTFATVGAIFSKSREEFLAMAPSEKPSYKDTAFDAYRVLDSIENTEDNNKCLFANDMLKLINAEGGHEIASHTHSHYYSNEEGQTPEQFEADLIANIEIAKKNNIDIKSIVFPRNQLRKEYLAICNKYGIRNYRGTEKNSIYKPSNLEALERKKDKSLRLVDSYFNITGINDYYIDELKDSYGANLKSSRFFRPYNSSLFFLEPFKVKRITKAMTHAAENNKVYHLWWHPHNFGKNIEKNFKQLKDILEHYKCLNEKYDFKSVSMAELGEKINTI